MCRLLKNVLAYFTQFILLFRVTYLFYDTMFYMFLLLVLKKLNVILKNVLMTNLHLTLVIS